MNVFRTYLKFKYSQFGPPVVHQLVYQMHESFGIPLHVLQLLSHPCVAAFGYHFLQRIQYKRERGTHLM